jgi:hypothetical protein
MNSIRPEDFASEQQIARNHARVAELSDRSGNLFADLDAQARAAEAASMMERHANAERERRALAALHSCGADLPLFA